MQKVVKPGLKGVPSIEDLEKVYQKLINMSRSCKSICYPSHYGKYITNDNMDEYLKLLRDSHTVHMVASCGIDFFGVILRPGKARFWNFFIVHLL